MVLQSDQDGGKRERKVMDRKHDLYGREREGAIARAKHERQGLNSAINTQK